MIVTRPLEPADRRARRAPVRLAVATALAVLGVVGFGDGTVHADPAEPTDYRSEIVSITPAVAGIEVEVVGGDAFIELSVAPGIEVVVLGYQGEPYLRFAPDGTVQENLRSPTRYLDDDRYGEGEIAADADATAPPEWTAIGDGGRWAWHDHRTHWMSTVPPLGLQRGDQVLDDVVPLVVDGIDVEVAVVSYWMPAPSLLPAIVGGLLGIAGALGLMIARRRRLAVAAVVAVAAAGAALVVGIWQTRSLPSETAPPPTAWVLPALGTGLAMAAIVSRWAEFTRWSLVLLAAAQLVVWFVLRRTGLTRAILPTAAPFWFDRAATAAVGVLAVGVLVAALAALGAAMGVRAPSRRAPRSA